MIINRRGYLSVLLCLCLNPIAHALEWTGFAAIEHRQFFEGPQFTDQNLNSGPSFIIEPEVYHVSEDERHILTGRAFFRLDPYDDERTHADIRQLDWVWSDGDWEIRAGISKIFWGVTESRHLVDIINQTDSIEDVDEEDKFGQPLIQLATFQDWGTIRLYYMPYFRERSFSGKQGRLRFAIPIADDDAQYRNDLERWHPDVALRYTHTLGDWDIGIAHFHGTSREPVFEFNGPRIRPVYEIIDQTSVDIQYTTDAWLWKLEAFNRIGQGDAFYAAVGGFEYTFYGVWDTDIDVGLIFEFHRDTRGNRAPPTFFNHDGFIGTRIAWNDVDDTELLAGIIFDTKDSAQSALIEASRRLTDNLLLEADARFFSNGSNDDITQFLHQDDFVQIRLSYYL